MELTRESRKRFRPWLERMINSQECPGLEWEDREQKIFRIPWKHKSHKEWDEKDTKLFKEWEKFTGRYEEGGEAQHAQWKVRFRCTLNKIPEIKELPDRHNLDQDSPNPYKVYQFVDAPAKKTSFRSESSRSNSPASIQSASPYARDQADTLFAKTSPLNIMSNSQIGSNSGTSQLSNVPTVIYEDDPNLLDQRATPQQEYPNFLESKYNFSSNQDYSHYPQKHLLLYQHPNCQSFGNPQTFDENITPEDASLFLPDSDGLRPPYIPAIGTTKSSLPSDLGSLDSGDLCRLGEGVDIPMSSLSTPEISLASTSDHAISNAGEIKSRTRHSFKFFLYYGFPPVTAMEEMVGGKGCRLFYDSSAVSTKLENTCIEELLFGPKDVRQIELPMVEQFADINDEQQELIRGLLNGMTRGVVLTISEEGDIFAHRLCRTRIHHSSDGFSKSQLLSRTEASPTKIFDYSGEFLTKFNQYMDDPNKEAPKHFVFLTVGQKIKMNQPMPRSQLVMHLLISHTVANEMMSNKSTGNFSIESNESSLNSGDRLLEQFKKLSTN